MESHLQSLNFLNEQFKENYTEWTLELDKEIDSLTSDELFYVLDRFILYISIKKRKKITTDSLLFKMIRELVKKILVKIYRKEFKRSDNWEYRNMYDQSRELFDFLFSYSPIKKNINGKIIGKDRYNQIFKNYHESAGLPDIFAHDFLKKFTGYQ